MQQKQNEPPSSVACIMQKKSITNAGGSEAELLRRKCPIHRMRAAEVRIFRRAGASSREQALSAPEQIATVNFGTEHV